MGKPPKFQVGQQVVCIKLGRPRPDCLVALRQNQIYQVADVQFDNTPGDATGWWITRHEWAGQLWAHESLFAPVELASDEALAELLADAFTPVPA